MFLSEGAIVSRMPLGKNDVYWSKDAA